MIDTNEALTVYLGTDERGGYMPGQQEERLQRCYGDHWQQAMDVIRVYLQFSYSPDWSQHDLKSAGDAFTQAISTQFPELAPHVTRALGNRFTFGWR